MRTAVSRWFLSFTLLTTAAELTLNLPSRASAQSQDVLEQLRNQARTWQAKGRLDKASEAYEKVLRSRPDDAEALEALGLWHAHAGRIDKARSYLTELEKVAPNSQGTERLRAALTMGKGQDALITRAREQVRAGNPGLAIASYEQAFGGAKPPQHLALEYYQTLGGTEGGWDRARSGLEELVRDKPSWKEAKLALARHLTYRERARRDGIEALHALRGDQTVGADATAAWRQALLWLQAAPSDAPRFQQYLEQVGEDPAVRAKMSGLSREGAVAQRSSSTAAGYQALDREDIDEASRQFARAGDVPEAMVGLAVVAMRKEDFELAVKLLEHASKKFPAREDQWGQPLRSARFWLTMRKADALIESNPREAERLLREAVAISPEESHHARAQLASVLQTTGRAEAAEAELRQALAAEPDQALVLRALINLLIERRDFEGAIEANLRLAQLQPEIAWPPGELEAEVLRRRALEQHAAGDLEHTKSLLDEAGRLAPDSYWVVHDLAGLDMEMGELKSAQQRVAKLLELKPNEPAGRLMRARLEAELGSPAAGLEMLGGLPDAAAQGQVGRLRAELTLKKELDAAVRASAAQGHYASRRDMLRLQKQAEAHPDLLGNVALGWAEIGEPTRGVELLQQVLAGQNPQQSGTMMQLAAVYLRGHMDDELRQLIDELASDPSLSPRARRDLTRLHVAFAVGNADRLASAGEFNRALALLEPLLVEYPDDAALLCGLGRMFVQASDFTQASATFARVLQNDPGNVEARDGAISAALAAGKYQEARELLDTGLRAQPRSARLHLVAAHYHLARGDDANAMRELGAARLLAQSGQGDATTVVRAADPVTTSSRDLLVAARVEMSGRPLSAAEGKSLVTDIDKQIDQVRERHAVQIEADPSFRHRDGEHGLGRLTELRLPVGVSLPLGYFGRFDVGADVVSVNAGSARIDNPDVAARFGLLGVVPAIAAPRKQDDVGVAPHAAFAYRDRLRLEVGSTPLGFLKTNIIGSLSYRFQFGAYALTLKGERAPVTNSLLSYAGTTDPATGKTWGAVVSQGGSIDFATQTNQYLFYLLGVVEYLTGERVANNVDGRIATGLLWTLYDWDGHSVRFGGTGLFMAYAKNQSGFTLGQGGYFSPEWFTRAGVPLQYHYTNHALRTKLEVDPGLNWFRREAADYYPVNADLQAQAKAVQPIVRLPGNSNLGFSLNVIGEVRYDLSARFSLGASGSVHFANDYREYKAALFARLNFNRRVAASKTAN